jgi:hypothetical protein
MRNKTLEIIAVGLALVFGMAAEGDSSSETTDTTIPAKPFVMPKITGMSYARAVLKVEKASQGFYLESVDVLQSRSVWDDANWKVLMQNPKAGATVFPGDKICAGVAKNDEAWRTPKHFGCWGQVSDTGKMDIKMSENRMYLNVDGVNTGQSAAQYRATVEVNTDDGDNLTIQFCSATPTKPGKTLNQMRLTGKNEDLFYDTTNFTEYRGRISYSVKKLDRSVGSRTC